VVGFIIGGLVAAVVAGVTLVTVFPIPPDESGRPNYGPVALTAVVIASFFSGGFIGRRAFSADFWSDLLPSVATSYGVMLFLCPTASLDFRETAFMIGFASAGIVISATFLIFLGRRFHRR